MFFLFHNENNMFNIYFFLNRIGLARILSASSKLTIKLLQKAFTSVHEFVFYAIAISFNV